MTVPKTNVNRGLLIVTVPLELIDMASGRFTVMLRTEVICGMLVVQPPNVHPVIVRVLVPGAAGLEVTVSIIVDTVHDTAAVPVLNTAFVPGARTSVITSLTFTLEPPTLPTVSTPP